MARHRTPGFTHKEIGITNNPNDWAKEVGNPRYILELKNLRTYYSTESGVARAVDGVSFSLEQSLSEATSNENWSTPTKILQEIADATYS